MSPATASVSVAGPGPSPSVKPPSTFDFTKRKRWADLLVTELVDNIIFILSPVGKILFCGASVTDLLGWKDVELIDINFMDLVDPQDHARFRSAFNTSIQTSEVFDTLIRLRCNTPMSLDNSVPPNYVLYDIKSYPHSTDESANPVCFFAMATPYPSRNKAMLDTILDLKVENDRLQHLVAEYRSRLPPDGGPHPPSSHANNSIYAMSSLNTQRGTGVGGATAQKLVDQMNAYPLASGMMLDERMMAGMDFGGMFGCEPEEQPVEDGSKKKKLKRSHIVEQYVCMTCGRTESPEWRKGPGGPKTLCNACGLRWAKQNKPSATSGSGGDAVNLKAAAIEPR